MKAAIYNPYLDTLGGGERYTLSFARVLADKGYSVFIEWKDAAILNKLENRFGIATDNIKVTGSVERGDGYDVLFWVSDGSIPLLKARKNFLHFQFPFTDVNGSALHNKMKFFRINKSICNSDFTRAVIDKEYGIKSIVIYPPVATSDFKVAKKENYILYVGRFSDLTQKKGHDVLIETFKRIFTDLPQWRLVLAGGAEVGSSSYLNSLKEEAKGFPIDFIESPSFIDLVKLYSHASLFWSAAGYGVDEIKNPKQVEHFGISVVEAMAAESIPLVCNKGGYKEIVENGVNGFLWDTIEQLIDSTLNIIAAKELRKDLAKRAKRTSEQFSYTNFQKEVSKIL